MTVDPSGSTIVPFPSFTNVPDSKLELVIEIADGAATGALSPVEPSVSVGGIWSECARVIPGESVRTRIAALIAIRLRETGEKRLRLSSVFNTVITAPAYSTLKRPRPTDRAAARRRPIVHAGTS